MSKKNIYITRQLSILIGNPPSESINSGTLNNLIADYIETHNLHTFIDNSRSMRHDKINLYGPYGIALKNVF